MDAHAAINNAAAMSMFVLARYLEDLSDADLMRRPGPGCNHLAWQLGHLISSEVGLLESVAPGAAIELPAGFAAAHSPETAGSDEASKFHTKGEYLDLFGKARGATAAALAKLSPTDLDAPGPERFREFFPTVGDVFLLLANHPLMHAGQFVPVRRALGKPVTI
mgnify:CR=1 FL=1